MINRFTIVCFLFFLMLLEHACIEDFDDVVANKGELSFSKDTIFLDTIFTNISSSTRTLKIYNKSPDNISIPSIKLGRGESSFYRLNVDGVEGKLFDNIEILANDSIYVFIEATIDFNKVTNPIYTDSIVFDKEPYLQDVKLVTLVQDAHFLFPKKDADGVKEKIVIGYSDDGEIIAVEGFYLENSAIWKNDKPYVVYGYVGVNSNNSLTIEKGTQVYFHQNSGILVEKNASLKVKGVFGEEVVFSGDRLESFFSDTPGQWGTIWLRPGSKNHIINHAIIKNNTIGILMDSIGNPTDPTLKIYNTQIYNTASFGLLGRAANIEGKNVVIGNNGQSSLACTYGGTYNFKHATFANYWNNSIRGFPTVRVNNFLRKINSDGSEVIILNDLSNAIFTNCIIDGNQNIEFLLDKMEGAEFNFKFINDLLKFDDSNGNFKGNPLYDFEDVNHYQNVILNGFPDFKDVENHNYIIGSESDGINRANQNTAAQVPLDLLNTSRLIDPDIGAYQHVGNE